MTLVPNETEQALNRQYDVYAAARDEYRKKIAEQAAEIERLRADLRLAVMSDSDECKALSQEVERLVKSRNRWGQKYNALLEKHKRLRAALREAVEFIDQAEMALTPRGETYVAKWRAALEEGRT